MRALCWHGKGDIRCDQVADPTIEADDDVIIRVTSCAICGSDLHLMDGYIPGMQSGDVMGHEFMGEIVETGREVTELKRGDRVVVPFNISCGTCRQCRKHNYAACERSNRNGEEAKKAFGQRTGGSFGYSHLTGGYAGGQAEFVRIPFAEHTAWKVSSDLPEEKLLFLGDILPTGWMAAKNLELEPTDTVAVWGCGPVGQFVIESCKAMGAARIIAIDRVPERLAMAEALGAETIDFSEVSVPEALTEMTRGTGPEKCVDAVGMEAHGGDTFDAALDRMKAAVYLATDRAHALRESILCCRPGGTVSVPGVYGGVVDKFPMGAMMNKGLTLRTGQTHVRRYLAELIEKVEQGALNPDRIITHRAGLDDGPELYKTFRDKQDGCVKVVLRP